jgi:hypothetical protein
MTAHETPAIRCGCIAARAAVLAGHISVSGFAAGMDRTARRLGAALRHDGYISLGRDVLRAGGYLTVLTWPLAALISLPAASARGLVALCRLAGPACARALFVIITYGLAELVKFIVIDIEVNRQVRLTGGRPPLETSIG